MRVTKIILIVMLSGLSWTLHAKTDTIWNTINMGELVLKGNRLIRLPPVKGGGMRAYLFEIDENTLGLAYFRWGSRRGTKTLFKKAYKWNSKSRIIRRWRRVRSNLVFSSGPRSQNYSTLCGNFSNMTDVCFYYDNENYQGLIEDESFEEMIKRHGLVLEYIKSSEHRKYRIRFFVSEITKYVIYFILILLGIRLFGRKLIVKLKSLTRRLNPKKSPRK